MIPVVNKLCRRIFCCGGHGVHSPFVFDLITRVIEEKRSYYCYEWLNVVRLQLLQDNNKIVCNNREFTIKKVLNKSCFTERECKLLFRLANRFQPKTIYVMGSDLGLAPLYLTAYSKSTCCTVIEPEPSVATTAQKMIDRHASARIDICDISLSDLHSNIDFIVWGKNFSSASGNENYSYIPLSVDTFNHFLSHINNESVMIISGINASQKNRNVWKLICSSPEVSVTLDLYSLGIVFFNPKLHRRTYKSFVL